MESKIYEYDSADITVQYDVKRCIHAAECVRTLPKVFDPNKRPWINPTEASAAEIVEAVHRCPTGALHYVRKDNGPAETPDEESSTHVEADGPLYMRGDVEIRAADGTLLLKDSRVALCRCGASKNKPLCDNSHKDIKFSDPGSAPA